MKVVSRGSVRPKSGLFARIANLLVVHPRNAHSGQEATLGPSHHRKALYAPKVRTARVLLNTACCGLRIVTTACPMFQVTSRHRSLFGTSNRKHRNPNSPRDDQTHRHLETAPLCNQNLTCADLQGRKAPSHFVTGQKTKSTDTSQIGDLARRELDRMVSMVPPIGLSLLTASVHQRPTGTLRLLVPLEILMTYKIVPQVIDWTSMARPFQPLSRLAFATLNHEKPRD